jgi:FkbM family methyltransferase
MKFNINKKEKLLIKIILSIIIILFIIYILYYFYKSKSFIIENYNETILIDDCIYGKFKCFKKDSTICNSIITTKSWEKNILDLLIENYKPNTNILDIGSNYGCHSIGLANEIKKSNGSGKVYSFEVQPEIFKLFKENIELNDLNNIIIPNEFGLGDKDENKTFVLPTNYDDNGNPGALSLKNQNTDLDKNKEESVKIKRLDDLNIDNISLIKIDVEGYELEVFEGGKETIRKYKPVILIEIWGVNKDKYTSWINENFPFYNIENISNEDYILRSKDEQFSNYF